MSVKIKQFIDDATGEQVAGRTPEKAVYDTNGTRLDDKILTLATKTELSTKADASALAAKADITYVDTQLAGKASTSAVGEISSELTDILDQQTTAPTIGASNGWGVWGVKSQTQTWSSVTIPTASRDYSYEMSNIVYGWIPKSFIDCCKAVGISYNTSTGYFSVNGLTDISYEECTAIYSTYGIMNNIDLSEAFRGCKCRTVLWPVTNYAIGGFAPRELYSAFSVSNIETLKIDAFVGKQFGTYAAFSSCYYLRKIIGTITCNSRCNFTSCFDSCYSLEELNLKGLVTSVSLKNSAKLNAASVAYMINNAGTATIVITLNATAYARAMADADVQAALAAKTNVSLASA